MATSAGDSNLVISFFDPAATSHDRSVRRSAALSLAAKVTHARRERAQFRTQNSNTLPQQTARTSARDLQRRSLRDRDNARRQVVFSVARTPALGNSDPFRSMTIPITPEITMLLSLWKRHARANAVSATRWITETALRQDLVLDDQLHARSLLLLCSTLLSSQFPPRHDLQVRRLERKHGSIRQLKALMESNTISEGHLVRALSLILMASVLANEATEAKLHARRLYQALRQVDPSQLWEDQERVITLSRIYYYDQQCALIYVRPPFLDPSLPVQHWQRHLAPLHA